VEKHLSMNKRLQNGNVLGQDVKRLLAVGLLLSTTVLVSPVSVQAQQKAPQQMNSSGDFAKENFVIINPTLPNDDLNFSDDSNLSCCQKDYPAKGNKQSSLSAPKQDPYPAAKSDPRYVYDCRDYETLPELVSYQEGFPDLSPALSGAQRTVFSDSTVVSKRQYAGFFANVRNANGKITPTDSFHIGSEGGMSLVSMRDVSSYSVCMARGGNVASIGNTDNASVATFNGADRVIYAGNNTNMLTKTGAGSDVIEIHQAMPVTATGGQAPFRNENWQAYSIYRTAMSGGTGEDMLVIKDSPAGTKWCFLGGYHMFGEYFYVVEFALPPSVTQGPRRQRINIGRSMEYVMFQGKKYSLANFLHHGTPADEVARSKPIGEAPAY
jgi:hypothetical protein